MATKTDKAGKKPAHSTITRFRGKLGSVREHTWPLIEQMVEYRPGLAEGKIQGERVDKLELAIANISKAYRLMIEADALLKDFDPISIIKELDKRIEVNEDGVRRTQQLGQTYQMEEYAKALAELKRKRRELMKHYKLQETDIK